MDGKIIQNFWKISALLLAMFYTTSAQENKSDSFNENYSAMFIDYGHIENNSVSIHQIFLSGGNIYKNKSLEYRFALMPISFVRRNSQTFRYSFQLPVSLVLYYVGSKLDKIFYPNQKEDFWDSPRLTTFLFYSPFSSIQYKISKKTSIGFSNSTDFLLIRDKGLDRGILVTPAVGMTYFLIDGKHRRSGFTFSLTYSHFFNYDSASEADGFGFKINLYWTPSN